LEIVSHMWGYADYRAASLYYINAKQHRHSRSPISNNFVLSGSLYKEIVISCFSSSCLLFMSSLPKDRRRDERF